MGQQVFWETTEHTKHTLCVEVPLHVMLNWTKQKQDKFGFMVDTFCLFIPTATVISVHPDTCPRYSNQRGHSRHTKCPFWFGSLRLFFCFEEPQQSMPGCGTNRPPPPPHTHTQSNPSPSSDNNEPQAQQHCEGSFPQLGASTPKQVTGINKCVHMHSMYRCTVCTYACIHTHKCFGTNKCVHMHSMYTCTVCTYACIHTCKCLYIHAHANTQCAQHKWGFTLNTCMQ